jgi:hypothetical protein
MGPTFRRAFFSQPDRSSARARSVVRSVVLCCPASVCWTRPVEKRADCSLCPCSNPNCGYRPHSCRPYFFTAISRHAPPRARQAFGSGRRLPRQRAPRLCRAPSGPDRGRVLQALPAVQRRQPLRVRVPRLHSHVRRSGTRDPAGSCRAGYSGGIEHRRPQPDSLQLYCFHDGRAVRAFPHDCELVSRAGFRLTSSQSAARRVSASTASRTARATNSRTSFSTVMWAAQGPPRRSVMRNARSRPSRSSSARASTVPSGVRPNGSSGSVVDDPLLLKGVEDAG